MLSRARDASVSEQGRVTGFCEDGGERWGSVKCRGLLEWARSCSPLKMALCSMQHVNFFASESHREFVGCPASYYCYLGLSLLSRRYLNDWLSWYYSAIIQCGVVI